MPHAYLDTEQAELLIGSATMLQMALQARVKRADPEKIISNSLVLQANKLESVIAQLAQPDPPTWRELTEEEQTSFLALCSLMVKAKSYEIQTSLYDHLCARARAARGRSGELALVTTMEDSPGGSPRR